MVQVTVIMLSYNRSKYIGEAIESVLSQTFQDLELLIIDNNSQDGTMKIIKEYASSDSRIVPVFNERNLGIAGSRNKALKKTRGKFVAFMDSDDVWCENKLEEQMKILTENEDLVVFTEADIIDASGRPFGVTYSYLSRTELARKSGKVLHELLKKGNFVLASSLILKTDWAKVIGFEENLRYMDDYRFVIQLAKKLDFYWIEQPLVKYRVHDSSAHRDKREYWDNDGEKFATIVLEEDSAEMRNPDKSIILWDRGRARLRLGKWGEGLHDLLTASLVNPQTIILKRLMKPLCQAFRGRNVR